MHKRRSSTQHLGKPDVQFQIHIQTAKTYISKIIEIAGTYGVHACEQVCSNTLRNCLPRRFDVDLDTRGHDWEVDGKLMLFIHVDQLSLSNNR